MQRRADSGNWALPGGGMEICYAARISGGQLTISSEATEIGFIDPAELPGLPIHPTQQLRINHYLDNRNSPYLG